MLNAHRKKNLPMAKYRVIKNNIKDVYENFYIDQLAAKNTTLAEHMKNLPKIHDEWIEKNTPSKREQRYFENQIKMKLKKLKPDSS